MSQKVADLTVEELRELLQGTIRDLVQEIVDERIGHLVDPDEDLELRPEVAKSLQTYLDSEQQGDAADEVFRTLGLE